MVMSTLLIFTISTSWLRCLFRISNTSYTLLRHRLCRIFYTIIAIWKPLSVLIFLEHSNKQLIINGVMLSVPYGSPKFHSRIQFSLSQLMDFVMYQKLDGTWSVTFAKKLVLVLRYSAIKRIVIQLFMLRVRNMQASTWWWKLRKAMASTALQQQVSQRYFLLVAVYSNIFN